jgi:isoquinoline 1-oxidoreductase beta subunit
VTVNITLFGGGFGCESKPDFMIEAAVLSTALGGAPVKVTWTRDDDLCKHLEAALDAQGKPIAWWTGPWADDRIDVPRPMPGAPFELGMTAINMLLLLPQGRRHSGTSCGRLIG